MSLGKILPIFVMSIHDLYHYHVERKYFIQNSRLNEGNAQKSLVESLLHIVKTNLLNKDTKKIIYEIN